MDKKEILSHVGNMQQVMAVRPVVFLEGRAEGLQAFLADKAKKSILCYFYIGWC